MGTISDKLTYLNTTKIKLRDSLNKFGSSILSTDTFRSYDTKLNEIYDKLPKVTQSGAGLTITPVQNGLVDDFKMNGVDLSQSITPTPDSPQEIKVVEGRQVITDKGKNLFDKDNITKLNGTININSNDFEGGGLNYAVCISCKPNTTYTVTKRNDGNTNRLALASSETIPSSTISELTPVLNKIRDNDSSTLTLTTEISANYLIVQYYRSAESILTEQQILDSIQIEESSTATDYEPYYEPVSYNIDLHGKNEFDGEYEDGYYNMNGTKPSTQDPYGRRSTNLNKIEPNTNYSISINNNIISETIRLFYYDASRKFISTESISNGTFTSPAECYYVSWHSSSLKQNYPDGIPNMMIEQGQTVTTYEDYYDYKLAKMPNTDYKNRIYKNNGNWYFEEKVKKYILDGTENWDSESAYNENYKRFLVRNYFSETKLNNNGMNNYFFQRVSKSHGDYQYLYLQPSTSNIHIQIYSNIANSLSNFKDWLSTHNVIGWHILDNSTTTQITNTTLINQLEALYLHTGTNIITISNDNNIIPEIEITRLKELEKLA